MNEIDLLWGLKVSCWYCVAFGQTQTHRHTLNFGQTGGAVKPTRHNKQIRNKINTCISWQNVDFRNVGA